MPLYNPSGGFNVTLVGQNDLPHSLYAPDGSYRVTTDVGLGLYAPNGSLRIVNSFSGPLYSASGALNGVLFGSVFTPLGTGSGVITPPYLPTVSVAPSAVYSLYKIRGTYSGPLRAACGLLAPDGTPGTSVNIVAKADGSPDFAAAIAAFGTKFALWKAYDQSGNGNDAVETTAIFRQIIDTTTPVRGLFGGLGGNAPNLAADTYGAIEFPSTLVTSRQNSTFVAFMSGVNGGVSGAQNVITSLGSVDVSSAWSAATNINGMIGRGNNTNLTYMGVDQNPCFIAAVSSASKVSYYRDANTLDTGAYTSATGMTGGATGRLIGDPVTTCATMQARFADIVYPAALSASDIAILRAFFVARFSIPTRTAQVVAIGDSIQLGLGQDTTATISNQNKWSFLLGKLTRDPAIYNFGKGGDTAANAVTELASPWMTNVFQSGLAKNVLCCNYGFNDINGGASGAVTYSNLMTLINSAKSAGFTVVQETITTAFFSGSKLTEATALNTAIINGAAAGGYSVINYSGTSINYVDGVHPYSIGGYDNMASTALPILNAALA